MSEASRLHVGIVGAGRSRNGLGPFLASHLEAAGGQVVAVSGRSADRAAAAADGLETRLGHLAIDPDVRARLLAVGRRWGSPARPLLRELAEAHVKGVAAEALRALLEGTTLDE